MKSRTNKPWFKQIRGSFIPVSWQGALTYIPMIAFLVAVMVYSLQSAKSVFYGLFVMFPYFVCTAVVMHWLAKLKS